MLLLQVHHCPIWQCNYPLYQTRISCGWMYWLYRVDHLDRSLYLLARNNPLLPMMHSIHGLWHQIVEFGDSRYLLRKDFVWNPLLRQ